MARHHLTESISTSLHQIVAKNAATGDVGVIRTQLNVPTYEALEQTTNDMTRHLQSHQQTS